MAKIDVSDPLFVKAYRSSVQLASELQELGRQWSEAEKVRQNLQLEITRKHAEIRIRRNSLLPVSRLPDELLLAIFKLAVNDSQTRGRYVRVERVVVRVCHYWRSLLLGAPTFWASIHVVPNMSIDCLTVYLELSSEAPLHISFHDWHNNLDPQWVAKLHQHLALLVRSAHRWERLTISRMWEKPMRLLLSRLERLHTPKLLSMQVLSDDPTGVEYDMIRSRDTLPFLTGGFASALRTLEIEHITIVPFHLSFSLGALTSLTLTATPFTRSPALINWATFSRMLSSCSSTLEYLSLTEPVVDFGDQIWLNSGGISRVALPVLRTLIIKAAENPTRYRFTLINSLCAPALSSLEIVTPHTGAFPSMATSSTTTNSNTSLLPSASQFFTSAPVPAPKSPLVSNLVLVDVTSPALPARTFFDAFPAVTDLTLGGDDVHNFALEFSEHTHEWKSLEVLTIAMSGMDLKRWRESVALLCAWLAARSSQGDGAGRGDKQEAARKPQIHVVGTVFALVEGTLGFLMALEELRDVAEVECVVLFASPELAPGGPCAGMVGGIGF